MNILPSQITQRAFILTKTALGLFAVGVVKELPLYGALFEPLTRGLITHCPHKTLDRQAKWRLAKDSSSVITLVFSTATKTWGGEKRSRRERQRVGNLLDLVHNTVSSSQATEDFVLKKFHNNEVRKPASDSFHSHLWWVGGLSEYLLLHWIDHWRPCSPEVQRWTH